MEEEAAAVVQLACGDGRPLHGCVVAVVVVVVAAGAVGPVDLETVEVWRSSFDCSMLQVLSPHSVTTFAGM